MTLYIDTSDLRAATFKLFAGKTTVANNTAVLDPYTSHELLGHLGRFLLDNGVEANNKYGSIEAISFFAGEGSHTGLRIGLAIAQGLSLSWNVPIKPTKAKR